MCKDLTKGCSLKLFNKRTIKIEKNKSKGQHKGIE